MHLNMDYVSFSMVETIKCLNAGSVLQSDKGEAKKMPKIGIDTKIKKKGRRVGIILIHHRKLNRRHNSQVSCQHGNTTRYSSRLPGPP